MAGRGTPAPTAGPEGPVGGADTMAPEGPMPEASTPLASTVLVTENCSRAGWSLEAPAAQVGLRTPRHLCIAIGTAVCPPVASTVQSADGKCSLCRSHDLLPLPFQMQSCPPDTSSLILSL